MSAPLPFSIFSYSSYLEFLQDAYEHFHSKNESFSYEVIASICEFKSRTHARNLLKGIQKAKLSEIKALARCFLLEGEEAKYLECLFLFEQAKNSEAAVELFQKLMAAQKNSRIGKNPLRELEVATSLLHMTVLSILDFEKAPFEVSEIKAALKDRFSEEDIARALSDLVELGFIQRTASGQRWSIIHKHVKKIDLNPNFFLARFHEQCLDVARDSLVNEQPGQRYLVGSNFSVNAKVFPRIVQKLNAFLENLMQLEGVAGGADTVVQINAQLIKMTADAHAKKESVPGVDEHAERAFSIEQKTM